MQITQNAPMIFDAAGFFLAICSLVIVLSSSKMVLTRVRQGFSLLAWGFIIIALSFVWSILFERLAIVEMPELQSPLLILGMAFIFFSSLRLFTFSQKPVESQNQ